MLYAIVLGAASVSVIVVLSFFCNKIVERLELGLSLFYHPSWMMLRPLNTPRKVMIFFFRWLPTALYLVAIVLYGIFNPSEGLGDKLILIGVFFASQVLVSCILLRAHTHILVKKYSKLISSRCKQ